MKMNKLIYTLMLIAMMVLLPGTVSAQSASESYSNGLALMKNKDYHGAIASFRASMAINKSAANVKKCKAQINKCQRLLKSNKTQSASVEFIPSKTLKVINAILPIPADPTADIMTTIEARPDSNDWTAEMAGTCPWIELVKSMDGKSLILKCQPTNMTVSRDAEINVKYGEVERKIKVRQQGRKVNLIASSQFTKFRKKGGQELIEIKCNSDTVYENNTNWYIEKAPEWCNAESTKTDLVLKIAPLEKGTPYYKSGRTGDIILRSQDQECIIRVDQK